jgi:hypothetical protein
MQRSVGATVIGSFDASSSRVAHAEPTLGGGAESSRASPQASRSPLRTLTEDDAAPGAPPAMVIGYNVWQSRFDADPAVLGRTVRLRGVVTTVVGVMPEDFG